MTEVLEQFLNELLASSALEIMAVSLALAYLILPSEKTFGVGRRRRPRP